MQLKKERAVDKASFVVEREMYANQIANLAFLQLEMAANSERAATLRVTPVRFVDIVMEFSSAGAGDV